jgi:Cu/Ag efflux protein CusF
MDSSQFNHRDNERVTANGVKAGDKIKFDAESVNSHYTLTKIEKTK